ncbi:hypothetical protein C8Q75DRAFT_817972 [Abortiporus biennis]|nr:hypothetical protein C8Q75DRAFT_817972 [Abortiporus biennis]
MSHLDPLRNEMSLDGKPLESDHQPEFGGQCLSVLFITVYLSPRMDEYHSRRKGGFTKIEEATMLDPEPQLRLRSLPGCGNVAPKFALVESAILAEANPQTGPERVNPAFATFQIVPTGRSLTPIQARPYQYCHFQPPTMQEKLFWIVALVQRRRRWWAWYKYSLVRYSGGFFFVLVLCRRDYHGWNPTSKWLESYFYNPNPHFYKHFLISSAVSRLQNLVGVARSWVLLPIMRMMMVPQGTGPSSEGPPRFKKWLTDHLAIVGILLPYSVFLRFRVISSSSAFSGPYFFRLVVWSIICTLTFVRLQVI